MNDINSWPFSYHSGMKFTIHSFIRKPSRKETPICPLDWLEIPLRADHLRLDVESQTERQEFLLTDLSLAV